MLLSRQPNLDWSSETQSSAITKFLLFCLFCSLLNSTGLFLAAESENSWADPVFKSIVCSQTDRSGLEAIKIDKDNVDI